MKNNLKKVIITSFALLGILLMSKPQTSYAATEEEKRAYKRATEIIEEQSISRNELKIQLEAEGFSKGIARYVVNSYTQDWEKELIECIEKYSKSDEVWTRITLKKKLKDEGFHASEIKKGIESTSIDWEKAAVSFANEYAASGNYSRLKVMSELESHSFTKEEIDNAVKKLKVNWNKKAYGKAKEILKEDAYSKEGLRKEIRQAGFTKNQAAYAIKWLKTNWKEQAVKVAKELKSDKYDYIKEAAAVWMSAEYKFTDDEIAYAIKKVYKD